MYFIGFKVDSLTEYVWVKISIRWLNNRYRENPPLLVWLAVSCIMAGRNCSLFCHRYILINRIKKGHSLFLFRHNNKTVKCMRPLGGNDRLCDVIYGAYLHSDATRAGFEGPRWDRVEVLTSLGWKSKRVWEIEK